MIPLGILGAATPRAVSAWTPADVFAVPGTGGFWLDPYDMGTLFQDAAGTTPVAADGDPVGLILDKSGNGVHASQPTSALRPVWRTSGGRCWIDGSGSEWMYLGDAPEDTDFPTLYLIARARSAVSNRSLVVKQHATPHAAPWLRWGLFHEYYNAGGFPTLQTRVNGTEYRIAVAGGWPLSTDVTPIADNPGGQLRCNGLTTTMSSSTITYPNAVRARLFHNEGDPAFSGRLYGAIGVARALSSGEKANVEAWMGSR